METLIIGLLVLLAVTLAGSIIEKKKANKRYKQLETLYFHLREEHYKAQDQIQELINEVEVKGAQPITKN